MAAASSPYEVRLRAVAASGALGADRPTGTVTFFVTDIEGSTGRWEEQSAEMGAALAKRDDTPRKAIEAHGGRLLKHTGDGALAAFVANDTIKDGGFLGAVQACQTEHEDTG